ncbi:MAG: DUF5680 domain-containing protein [Patescibacteria group bacterium]
MAFALGDVKKVFFEAGACGWSSDAQKIKSLEFPGSKIIRFVSGDFRVIDCYVVNQNSDISAGTKTIWVKDQPVWIMHYGGWYKKEAIPFLKSCLQRAYVEERRFYGGRGPYFVHDKKFAYVNKIERNDFADFAGEERIFYYVSEQPLGYHWYRGMSLLKNN